MIEAPLLEVNKQQEHLTADVDLTECGVSPTSADYPDADFGRMDDETNKGYQAAVSSLVCEGWQRLMLTSYPAWGNLQRYAGRILSADGPRAAVQEVEEVLGGRPLRRVELV